MPVTMERLAGKKKYRLAVMAIASSYAAHEYCITPSSTLP
jgi:hypothetical protein